MNRIRLATLTVFLFMLLPPLTRAQNGQPSVVRETASPCVKVRLEPRSNAERVGCLPPGTQVTVIDAVPFWVKVHRAEGQDGWVAKKFVESATAPAPEPANVPSLLPANAFLEIHFVDVGQGDGVWMHTFDDGIQGNGIFEGRNIIIDGGPDASDTKNAMLKYLQQVAHHDAVIDALFISHPHNDHYPGAEGILRHFEVRKYYDPGFPKEGVAYPHFLDAVRQETADGHPSKIMIGKDQFDTLDFGREITVEVIYAYPGSPDGLGTQQNTIENNASIVLRVVYGKHAFLFMGDAEGKGRHSPPDTPQFVEKILLGTVPHEKLKATVLKIAHHGSETSSTLPFITAVDPEIVVVSSGRKNFGAGGHDVFLPDKTTLQRYCCHNPNTRIYRTDQNDDAEGRTTVDDADGDNIVIRSNGSDIEVHASEAGQPFTVDSCQPSCPQ